MPSASISRNELFARLARGAAARLVVVTPNRRLARALGAEFDATQLAGGLASWEAPDLLPLPAFLERLWDDAMHGERAGSVPMLLAPSQETQLWEDAIRATERGRALLAVAQAAEQCRAAWQLRQAWRIGEGPGSEDAEAFAEWSRGYLRRAGTDLDAARLPDAAQAWIDAARVRTLVAYAFDLVTPQQRAFLEACAARGIEVLECAPDAAASSVARASFADARAELEAAAQWARDRLEAGARRIGVVLPDLSARRAEVVRIFSCAMCPAHHVPGAAAPAMPFNVSAGQPLSAIPVVQAALALLALAVDEVEFPVASRLVRSPFLGGAESEHLARARLDARLRRELPPRVSLARLVGAAAPCAGLRARLEALYAAAQQAGSTPRSPHEWARQYSALLSAAGFPGERGLDSGEFQALARWHEALAEFARLERVAPRLGAGAALARLRRLCADALFQPESPDAPVQVLGVLESAGLRFDGLWVAGLVDEAWPVPAHPNPFVPVALQRKAGVPEASADGSLAVDRRITAQWLRSAPEVVLSHPLRDGERELLPSPLIAHLPVDVVPVSRRPSYRDVLFEARTLEPVADGVAPPLATGAARGGTRVLADQSDCPFRAFARHRLGARALEEPAPGLDAAGRGTLLHELMARLWRELKSSAALAADAGPAIERAAAGAVAALALEGRFAELERARLARLARDWLALERERAPFEVTAIEERRALSIGGLALEGRIDRIDRLQDGTHLVLDYKTGKVSRCAWLGERPADPQLPLYALAAPEPVSAIAYARLKVGEMQLTGYGAGDEPVDRAKDWQRLRDDWRAALESLARGFAAGDARVDPREAGKTCRLCDLSPLCRVQEKLAPAGDEEDGE